MKKVSRVVKLLILSSIFLVGCETKEFAVGDCIDRSDWVGEDGTFYGNSYTMVAVRTRNGKYLVSQCLMEKTESFSGVTCTTISPLPLHAEHYTKIECPKEPNFNVE